MKQYNVYQHPVHGYEAVKVGFSWPALFFNCFWMAVKKMWGVAVLFFFLRMILENIRGGLAGSQYEPGLQALLIFPGYVAWAFIPAFKGNLWRRQSLEKRGYEFTREIEAEHLDAALAEVAAERSARRRNESS